MAYGYGFKPQDPRIEERKEDDDEMGFGDEVAASTDPQGPSSPSPSVIPPPPGNPIYNTSPANPTNGDWTSTATVASGGTTTTTGNSIVNPDSGMAGGDEGGEGEGGTVKTDDDDQIVNPDPTMTGFEPTEIPPRSPYEYNPLDVPPPPTDGPSLGDTFGNRFGGGGGGAGGGGSRGPNDLYGDVAQYSRDWMAAPSRYDADVVQQGMEVIKARMDEIRRQGFNSSQDYLASKGLVGSTPGQELTQMNRASYDRQEQDQLFNLLREQALTYGQDRAAAGSLGLGAAGLGEDRYQFDRTDAYRNRELGLRGAELDLRKYGIDTDSYNRALDRSMEAGMFDRNMDFRGAQFDYMREQGDRDYALQRDEFGFRRDQAAIDNALRERALDLEAQGMSQDEAFRQAQFEWEQKEAERNRQFEGDMERRRVIANLLSSMGLEGFEGSPEFDAFLNSLLGSNPEGGLVGTVDTSGPPWREDPYGFADSYTPWLDNVFSGDR